MSVAMKLAYKRDINGPLVTQAPVTLLMQGDNQANVIELTLMDGASPASLDGYTATVYLKRADGVQVRCPGTVSGNVATVPLQAECYSVPGQYAAVMKLSGLNELRTVLRLAGYVESDGQGAIIDPSGSIPSYEDLERITQELEEALQQAETAISGANAAAQNANEKAAIADTAAGNANTAAGNANAGAGRANEAAESIEDLTVEASDVAYNQPATATVTDVGGHKHIAFGLRQGIPGDVPTITFSVETGEPGTDVQVEQSGAPDAPTVTLTIPRGDPGEGAVSSVDGLMPGIGGDVALGAVRYVSQTLEDLQKQQARENIGAGTGDGTVLSVDDVQPGVDGNVVLSAVQYASQSLTTEQQQQARTNIGIISDAYSGAGVHNAIYRGANLGSSVTDAQWAAIQAGTFAGLYIGDYWKINGVSWRIAAFDYYYMTGDIVCTNHHVVIVPDTALYQAAMNSTATTDGGYVGSQMYTSGLTQAMTTINSAFGSAHVLTHRQYLCNAVTNGRPSGGSWYDSTVELMTEQNCYGGKVFGVGNDGSSIPSLFTVDKSQYPLFAFRPDLISNYQASWLRDVVSNSSFANVNYYGFAYLNQATNVIGVRPAFSIYSPDA